MIIKSITKFDSNKRGGLKRTITTYYSNLYPDLPRIQHIIYAEEFMKRWLSELLHTS